MPLRSRIVLGLIVLALSACSQAPPTAGEAKDFAAVCDKANNGKRVAVEGYLRFPDSFTGDQSLLLRMYQTSDFKGAPIGVQMEIGTRANHLEKPPRQYTDGDLKVHLANGEAAVVAGKKVKVSGTVYFPIIAQEFACALENPLVELAK